MLICLDKNLFVGVYKTEATPTLGMNEGASAVAERKRQLTP